MNSDGSRQRVLFDDSADLFRPARDLSSPRDRPQMVLYVLDSESAIVVAQGSLSALLLRRPLDRRNRPTPRFQRGTAQHLHAFPKDG